MEVQEIKSSSNAHQWIIYLGAEMNEDLKKELADAIPSLRKIFQDESVSELVRSKLDLTPNSLVDHLGGNSISTRPIPGVRHAYVRRDVGLICCAPSAINFSVYPLSRDQSSTT